MRKTIIIIILILCFFNCSNNEFNASKVKKLYENNLISKEQYEEALEIIKIKQEILNDPDKIAKELYEYRYNKRPASD